MWTVWVRVFAYLCGEDRKHLRLSVQVAYGRVGNAPTTSPCMARRAAKSSRAPGEVVWQEEGWRSPRGPLRGERRSARRTCAAASCVQRRRDQSPRKVLSMSQRGASRCAWAAMHSVGRNSADLFGRGERSLHRRGLESHRAQAQSAVYDAGYMSQRTIAAGRGKEERKAVGASEGCIEHSVRGTHGASSCSRVRHVRRRKIYGFSEFEAQASKSGGAERDLVRQRCERDGCRAHGRCMRVRRK